MEPIMKFPSSFVLTCYNNLVLQYNHFALVQVNALLKKVVQYYDIISLLSLNSNLTDSSYKPHRSRLHSYCTYIVQTKRETEKGTTERQEKKEKFKKMKLRKRGRKSTQRQIQR